MKDSEQIEKLKKLIHEIADTIENMHKPEYATFFIDGEWIDGYQYAERIRELLETREGAEE